MSTPPPYEVAAEVAYATARERVLRTTDALLSAEVQVSDLSRRLDAALAELAEVRRQLEAFQVKGGEECGADTDPVGYAAAVGQAD